jgi:hypothetical protein
MLIGQGLNAPRMGLAGEPMTLAEDIGAVRSLALAPISVANNVTLVYRAPANRLAGWCGSTGTATKSATFPTPANGVRRELRRTENAR